MKKLFICSIALLCAVTNVAVAQTAEEVEAMNERRAKLAELCDQEPKSTGNGDVDGYAKDLYTAAVLSIGISEQLDGLYYRSIGETKDGVTDVDVKKPSLEELQELGVAVAAQAKTVASAAEKAEKAAKAAKDVKNPMAKAKCAKGIAYTAKVAPILAAESASQVKMIAEMIKTASTADNL